MRKIRGSSAQSRIAILSKRVVAGPQDLSERWIVEHGCVVLAEEKYRRISVEQAAKLVRAADSTGVKTFFAIANDDTIVDPKEMVFRVRATPDDLAAVDAAFFGLNLLLFNNAASVAFLSTYDEFSVLAAPDRFMRHYEPDREGAVNRFRDFIPTELPELQPAPFRALQLMEKYK